MTNAFPFIFLLTTVSTNWQTVQGDFKREGQTNYVRQIQVVTTNTYVYEVVLATNMTLFKREPRRDTNAISRWTPAGAPPLPPLPGALSKE